MKYSILVKLARIIGQGLILCHWKMKFYITNGKTLSLGYKLSSSFHIKGQDTSYHCNITGVHLSCKKTLSKIRSKCFWHKLSQDIIVFCKNCDKCAARKSPPKAPRTRYMICTPMERWAIDVMGPLPLTNKKNSYLVVVGYCFTK